MKNRLLLMVLFIYATFASSLWADCLFHAYEPGPDTGAVSIAAKHSQADVESEDDYLSVDNTQTWKAVHDMDGDLNGFVVKATPPVLGKRLNFDFEYMTGDMEGSFNTREVTPTPEGPYSGRADFDRDQYKVGANVFLLNSVYARMEYFKYEMDGRWIYTSVVTPDEPQEYEYEAITLGAGFRHDFLNTDAGPGFEGNGLGLILDLFGGCTFFDHKHVEKTNNLTYETDGIGYKMSADLLATYNLKVKNKFRMHTFAGVGFDYEASDEDNLDITNKGFSAKAGIQINF